MEFLLWLIAVIVVALLAFAEYRGKISVSVLVVASLCALLVPYFLANIADTYVSYQWFGEFAQTERYLTVLYTKIAFWIVGAAIGAIQVVGLGKQVRRVANLYARQGRWNAGLVQALRLIPSGIEVVSAMIWGALAAALSWKFLPYWFGEPFGYVEQVLSKDAAFYVYRLPFYRHLANLILFGIVVSGIYKVIGIFLDSVVAEFEREPVREIESFSRRRPTAAEVESYLERRRRLESEIAHVARYVALFAALVAVGLCLKSQIGIWDFVLSPSMRSAGPGYNDVVFGLPLLRLAQLSWLVFAGWLFSLYRNGAGGWWKGKRNVLFISAHVSLLLLTIVGPYFTWTLFVRPTERETEMPYIERGITATRQAYAIDHVEKVKYEPVAKGTLADIKGEKLVTDNIRIADWRMMKLSYSQFQELRTYYDFPDVDIDRYRINGVLRTVMLGSRELNQDQLPTESKTWENLRLNYTHGYGIVASYANAFDRGGDPEFLVKNIPPQSSIAELTVTRPAIYFGEATTEHIYTGTRREEFDHPSGNDSVPSRYEGKAGFAVGGPIRRFLTALHVDGFRLLLSSYISSDSRIILHRKVDTRLYMLAPFLARDNDPYKVVRKNGSLVYIVDMYSTTDAYPYSQRYGSLNYIRNSVKAVVDAYDGTVDLYVADPSDPMIQTWRRIFPKLFRDISEMPEDLREHVRYPEDLFSIQARIYGDYHMTPATFYMREDRYAVARELHVDEPTEQDPYYAVTKIPGAASEEFLIMQPLTPAGKDNLTAWMAGHCDNGTCNRLSVFEMNHDLLTFGPMQMEAKINAHKEMSATLTLWKQKGSDVLLGNMLAIPTQWGILYVKAMFIAAQHGSIPQLAKVAVGWGDRVEWGDTFEDALARVFGDFPNLSQSNGATVTSGVAAQAGAYLDEYLKLMGEGKVAEAGTKLEAARSLLKSAPASDSRK